ncbi:hypothetical protein RvY_11324 [Ramazzottius varieornatus]|uniref:Uncharacterized protein n=1 Tax=Ramazzottius varieornatus TaxID=947166 RepID=A0A1D1VFS4_RAMVA|nr:hypothetical protein RvY_11324 [Ramazzottius varieornatus]
MTKFTLVASGLCLVLCCFLVEAVRGDPRVERLKNRQTWQKTTWYTPKPTQERTWRTFQPVIRPIYPKPPRPQPPRPQPQPPQPNNWRTTTVNYRPWTSRFGYEYPTLGPLYKQKNKQNSWH